MISHGVEISIAGGGADEKDGRAELLQRLLCKNMPQLMFHFIGLT